MLLSSSPRRKELAGGDSALFYSGEGEKRAECEAGGPSRERTPPQACVPAKRDIGYPEKVQERALIAEPGDKRDYQPRALSQKVS